MQIKNSFTVSQPVDALWMFLLDVERVAPCMPGAELTEMVNDHTWKGKVNVKLGPVSLAFAGTVTIDERDDEAHRVVLSAKGMEQRGKGAANAKVMSWLEPTGADTTVRMTSDLTLSGAVAQLSRGLLPEVSKRLTKEFADCLEETLSREIGGEATTREDTDALNTVDGEAPPTPVARPVRGISLVLAALWSSIIGMFRRLFRGRGGDGKPGAT
jgi:carbon monoxide dehydrogenase subunit G